MPPEPSMWQQHGLPGLIIGALFCGYVYLFRALREDADKQCQRHGKERDEWREVVGTQNTNVVKVVNELTDAVRDQVRANELNARIHDRNSRSLNNIARALDMEKALEKESDDDIKGVK